MDYKKELFKNTSTINVTDYGAGSKVFSSNKRQVSKIAKNAGISNKRAKLLMNLMQYYKPTSILEIGTSLGLSTAALSISLPNSSITTLEGCKETAKIALDLFNKYQFKNTKLIIGNFDETLAKQLNENTLIRAGGMVKTGSIIKDTNSLNVVFTVTDYQNDLKINYEGILPDLFAENAGVVVRGNLNTDGSFKAIEVLAKHDENYMPPEVAKLMQEDS